MYLKIAIMNNSGNVGKSMICDTLLQPRIKNSEKIKIETINSDGTQDETVAAKDIQKVFELIFSKDIAIIDIGASNIEIFMNNLIKLEGAHEEIDYYFIPTTPKQKQQKDTITTINTLLDIGVDPSKIKLIFNFNDKDYNIRKLYSVIFESDLCKILNLNKNLFVIDENPVFDMIGEMGLTFTELATDERDFKILMREEINFKKRTLLAHQRSAVMLSKKFVKELDCVFDKINSACNLMPTIEGACGN